MERLGRSKTSFYPAQEPFGVFFLGTAKRSLTKKLKLLYNRSMNVKTQIITDLEKALEKIKITGAEPVLEHPAQAEHGDYASNIAMIVFGKQSTVNSQRQYKTPLDLAQKIVDSFPKTDYLEKIEAVKPGFINLWLKTEYLSKQLSEVLDSKESFGMGNLLKGKKIMVEFAHPNTHKMFHIGHLRNISTGESLVRLFEFSGAKVIRANYQGDVGLHIAKAIYGILQAPNSKLKSLKTLEEKIRFLGETYATGAKAYEEEKKAQEVIKDINYLIYASAQRFNQEQGINPGSTDYTKFVEGRGIDIDKVYKIWKETRQWSLDYFDKIYKRVFTHYDRLYFESECLVGVDRAKEALQKKVLKESDGAIIFDGKLYSLDTRVFVNSLGLPTYEGKELALAKMELSEFGKLNKLIHVVGPEQASFFKITFKVEELLGLQKDQQLHFIYGWVRLKKGKMSSRTGQVVLGEWLLDEVKKRLQESYKMTDETAEIVVVGAVKYSMLKVSVTQEIAFDIDESINLHGDSGPYLQYTYARTRSVLKKSEIRNSKHKTSTNDKNSNDQNRDVLNLENSNFEFVSNFDIRVSNLTPEELSLLRTLYRFPEVVEDAARTYSPNLICTFLFDLAQKFNLFYDKHPILKADSREQIAFRLALTVAVGQVIKNGLDLLGIKVVEKM